MGTKSKKSKDHSRESQCIEWNESWRDEYLKWICGFANAEGGTLVICPNDQGEIVGLSNAPKLLEDIPNKVRDILGIMVDVMKHKKVRERGLSQAHRGKEGRWEVVR